MTPQQLVLHLLEEKYKINIEPNYKHLMLWMPSEIHMYSVNDFFVSMTSIESKKVGHSLSLFLPLVQLYVLHPLSTQRDDREDALHRA